MKLMHQCQETQKYLDMTLREFLENGSNAGALVGEYEDEGGTSFVLAYFASERGRETVRFWTEVIKVDWGPKVKIGIVDFGITDPDPEGEE